MSSPVSELTTFPCRVYLSSFEFCSDSNDAAFWISSEAELRAPSRGGSRDGAANRLVARSVKRGVLGNISSAFGSFKRFDDSLQRLRCAPLPRICLPSGYSSGIRRSRRCGSSAVGQMSGSAIYQSAHRGEGRYLVIKGPLVGGLLLKSTTVSYL